MLKGRLGLETARIPHVDRHGVTWLERGNLLADDGTITFKTAGFADVPAGIYGIPAEPDAADHPNQAINHAATAVLGLAQLAVAVSGAIPQLGFIHEDSGFAFPLDVADLYRDSVTVPIAFAAVKQRHNGEYKDEPLERTVRRMAGKRFRQEKLVSQMIDRIKEMFDADDRRGDERTT